MIETPVVGDAKEMSVEKIAELEKAGKLLSQSRYWVSLVENQRSQLQFSEQVPVVVARTVSASGRGAQENVTYQSVGTMLGLVGRVEGDSVLLQLDLAQSRLVPAPAKPEGEASESLARPRTVTTNVQSTLTIPPGKTVVAGGKETQTDKGNVQTWLLVSARANEARQVAADAQPQVKIFRLVSAKAETLAPMILGIFVHDNVQIAIDPRTNSLVARGDEKSLALIERILAALDEKTEEKKDAEKK